MEHPSIPFNIRSIVQASNMFFQNENMRNLNQEKLEMLFWALDRMAIRNTGRTFTRGTYVRFIDYPTTMLVHNLIYNLGYPEDKTTKYFNENVSFDDHGSLIEVREKDTEHLSQVDIMLINKVADHFANFTDEDMHKLMKGYPESSFNGEIVIDMKSFFENPDIDNDFFFVDDEVLEAARWTYDEIDYLSQSTGVNFHKA